MKTPGVSFSFDYHNNQSRPTVLFLHGFMGSKSDWAKIAQTLQDDYSTLTLDLPGHGLTETSDASYYEMDRCAASIMELLDELEIERINLIGYSMGGRLGLFLLINHPERFLTGVIESATAGQKTANEQDERMAHDELLAKRLSNCYLAEFLTDWYRQPLFGSLSQNKSQLDQLVAKRMTNDREKLALSLRMMGSGRQPNLWPDLNKMAQPTLFVAGEYDKKYISLIQQMSDLCPEASGVIIEGAGHNVHYEQPAEFTRQVSKFLLQYS